MKNLKQGFTLLLLLAVFVAQADNNPSNNNSATQFKTGNRNASTGIEAAFYNPAGTVFGKDGFAMEFSVLPFSSTQNVYDSEFDKDYGSKSSSVFYPAFNMAYKKDKFSVFSNIGITNGGGSGNYDNGLPMFERLGMYQMYMAIIGGTPGLPSNNPMDYGYSSSFEGSAYGIGGSVGAAYKFNDWISGAFAVQYSHQKNHQEGSLVVDFPAAGVDILTTDIDVDYTGSNMGFIFGLNIKPMDNLLIAQTFRYYTELELSTTINDGKDGGGMYVDGTKSKGTYVPYYSLGISYGLTEKLSIEGDLNLSLYSMLELDVDAEDVNNADYYNNGIDVGLGMEYQLVEKVNLGLGFTYSPAKMKQEYMSELEFENSSLWLNTGVTINATEKLVVNLAFQAGIPTEEVEKEYDSQLAPGTTYYQKYTKGTSIAFGLGVAYRF